MDPDSGPPSRPAGDDPRQDANERYGPLEVQRLGKDDGRALIVYTRVQTGGETQIGEADAPGRAGR
jgi:hypothetical protein